MTIAFLPLQPYQSAEYTLEIDKDLISAMNRWRFDRAPVMSPNQAILALLQKGLISEGYLPVSGNRTAEAPDALAEAFRHILAAKP